MRLSTECDRSEFMLELDSSDSGRRPEVRLNGIRPGSGLAGIFGVASARSRASKSVVSSRSSLLAEGGAGCDSRGGSCPAWAFGLTQIE